MSPSRTKRDTILEDDDVETTKHEKALEMARKLGADKGSHAVDTQYLPGGGRDTGRDAHKRAQALLKGWDDGDPGVDDVFYPPSWLSGEWADEPTPRDIAEECGVDPDSDLASEVCDAYCEAADDAYTSFILEHLRHVARQTL